MMYFATRQKMFLLSFHLKLKVQRCFLLTLKMLSKQNSNFDLNYQDENQRDKMSK